MSYIDTTNDSCVRHTFDEHRWVMQIRHMLDHDFDFDVDFSDIRVTVFNVPKTLRDTNPNAYTPQLVALGPYHYFRPELQEMERYKISSAKRIQNLNRGVKFDMIVVRFMKLEHRIRACYHRYLDINSETLAWMMAIDAAFLVEVTNIYANKEGNMLRQVSSRMLHLVDHGRRKSAHNDTLRDILMLENQIPLFILREMLQFWLPSPDIADRTLVDSLIGLCKDLSPFQMLENWERVSPSNCDHLLDFIYRVLVPKLEETVERSEHDAQEPEERQVCKFLLQVKNFLGGIQSKIMVKLPWIFISNLPGFAVLKTILSPDENHQRHHSDQVDPRLNREHGPLMVEEIMIPSVVELSNSGVSFVPTNGNITTISFDKESKKLYLPAVRIDENTEVLLRNLVAYEASCSPGPLVLARYTELMNGIIDTENDARVLRERGVILNFLKSDKEVANLWNGMSKSMRLTRVPFLDEVVENINKYYDGNWKVVACRVLTTYVIHSWQFLAFFGAALFLFLLMLQVLCNVMFCPRLARTHTRWRM